MERTSINTKLIINGNHFEPDLISEALNLIPYEVWRKGELPKIGKTPRKHCSWKYELGYQETYDTILQCKKILDIFMPRIQKLINIRTDYSADILIVFVVNIYDTTPGIIFDREFLDFVHAVGGGIEIDMYNYESEEE